jgi:hypothetical protein
MRIIDHYIKQMVQQLAPWSKHKRALGSGLPQLWTTLWLVPLFNESPIFLGLIYHVIGIRWAWTILHNR